MRSKVIPGLSRSGQSQVGCRSDGQAATSAISQHHIEAFTNMLLVEPEAALMTRFDALRKEGKSVDILFSRLLVGCAQQLGDMWADDLCSFGDVTLGLSVLHRILHRYGDALGRELPGAVGDPSVLVTPIPGETHIFAASLLATYFRAAQWRVYSGIDESTNTLLDTITEYHLDVLIITVSCEAKVASAEKLIRQMKAHSCNQSVQVMVGGPPFLFDAYLHESIGADLTAPNALAALSLAKKSVVSEALSVL
ncbi:MAG: cobalamin B12-binding domain-containing protein [Pseudomonadota bacterium]